MSIDIPIYGCLVCGRSSVGRFCGDPCRKRFDAGWPVYERPGDSRHILTRFPVSSRILRQGPHGAIISCAHCHKEFESLGPRCCSRTCERALGERAQNMADMGPLDPVDPGRRHCETCGARIPRWRNGKAVRKDARFCSQACWGRLRRNGGDRADLSQQNQALATASEKGSTAGTPPTSGAGAP
jgi:hypothetical protein